MHLRFASVWLSASSLLVSACFCCAFAQSGGNTSQVFVTPDSKQLADSVARYESILASPKATDSRTLIETRVQLATAHFLLHLYIDSLADLKPLESAGNQMPAQAWAIKGLDELELDRLAEAVPSLRRAVQANPKSGTARLALGDALARSGRMQDAAREYEQQTRLTPSVADAWYKLGLAHSQMSANLSHEEVKSSEQDVVQQLAAEEILAKGDYLNAARTLFHLARSSPNQPEVHAELGSALLSLGYVTAAGNHFRQELNKSESPLAELGLVQTEAIAADWDQAGAELEKLSEEHPKELLRLLEFPPAGLIQQSWAAGQMKPPTSFTQSHA